MKHVPRTLSFCYFIIMMIVCWQTAHAEERSTPSEQANNTSNLKNGALLYDNWLKVTHTQLSQSNPGYPSSSKKKGKNTWRCKECHGWDYIGNKGRYKKGPHYTGIKGLYDSRHKDRQYLLNALKRDEPEHDFSAFLTDRQRLDLVTFIRQGQIDVASAIDTLGKAKGSAQIGKSLYEAQCESCHGLDGAEIDFKGKKPGSQGFGWLSVDNPQETLHKIRWGHPGSDMPSMIIDAALSDQSAVDILSYGQTLPVK